MGNTTNNTNVDSTLLSLSEKESRVCSGVHGPDWQPKKSYSWLDWTIDTLTPGPLDFVATPIKGLNRFIGTILSGSLNAAKFDDIENMSPMEATEAAKQMVDVQAALNEQIVKRGKAMENAKDNFSSVTAERDHFTKKESEALSKIMYDDQKAIRCFKERKIRLDRILPIIKKRASDPIEA